MFSYRHFKKYVKRFFRELPKIAFISSIFGFVFFWVYLKNISMLDVFMKIDISAYGLVCIFIFFMMFFIVLLLPFYSLDIFFSDRDSFNLDNRLVYSISQSMMMLLLLIFLFSITYDYHSVGFIIVAFEALFFSLFMALISIYINSSIENRYEICDFIKRYFLSGFLIFPILLFVSDLSDRNNQLFLFVTLYFLCLIVNDSLSLKYFKKSGIGYCKFAARAICVFFILIVSINGFKIQRLVLKSSGLAQKPEQAGWYLVKNKDILDFFNADYSIKLHKNIAGIENYYINGYLIFNIGNVRVICPDNFEKIDDRSSNNQELDFSKCLNLTSEDIKFMGKEAPFEL